MGPIKCIGLFAQIEVYFTDWLGVARPGSPKQKAALKRTALISEC